MVIVIAMVMISSSSSSSSASRTATTTSDAAARVGPHPQPPRAAAALRGGAAVLLAAIARVAPTGPGLRHDEVHPRTEPDHRHLRVGAHHAHPDALVAIRPQRQTLADLDDERLHEDLRAERLRLRICRLPVRIRLGLHPHGRRQRQVVDDAQAELGLWPHAERLAQRRGHLDRAALRDAAAPADVKRAGRVLGVCCCCRCCSCRRTLAAAAVVAFGAILALLWLVLVLLVALDDGLEDERWLAAAKVDARRQVDERARGRHHRQRQDDRGGGRGRRIDDVVHVCFSV